MATPPVRQRPVLLGIVLAVLCSRPTRADEGGRFVLPEGAGRQLESAPFELPDAALGQGSLDADPSTQGLTAWFSHLGPRRPHQSFGALVLQAARLALGRPYSPQVELPGVEVVDFNVDSFQCVSLVEGALAMARCTWMNERSPACFRREVARLRYRHGTMDGFASRLHYFEDWLGDNAARGHLSLLGGRLGSGTVTRPTAFMSHHPQAFPAMKNARERKRIEAVERRLSHRPNPIVRRTEVARASSHLRDGDIVAIVTKRPDILVRHVGFVDKDSRGVVHLLHASDMRKSMKVVRTSGSLEDYLRARPEREGVLVARPLAPARKASAAQADR